MIKIWYKHYALDRVVEEKNNKINWDKFFSWPVISRDAYSAIASESLLLNHSSSLEILLDKFSTL